MNILKEIIAHKRQEIETPGFFRILEKPEGVSNAVEVPDFIAALRAAPIGLIAEVKRQSPSAGVIREPFDAAEIARAYEEAGAQAISCLMDSNYFGGGEAQWNAVRATTSLPVLYKEFVVDPRQILHAKALGASAVLLIAAALDVAALKKMIRQVEGLGMTALVEVHTAEEMQQALDAGALCIGINNRDLKTFETTIETTLQLCGLAPAGCTLISESGIRTAADVKRLHEAGISAVLVGESLLRQSDLESAVRSLMNLS